jgi:membrane dipeptidase
MMMKPMWSWAGPDIDPRVAAIVARTIGVDTHNHIDVPLDTDELPGPDVDLAGELKKSGLSAICMTFATDYKRNVQPGEAYQRFLNGLSAMDILLERNKMRRSFTLADIQTAHKEHRPTVIQSVEGCHFLEGNLDRVEVAYKRGVRHLGLLHDSNASVPLGDVYTNPPEFGGLTSFGSDVIKEANRLGMLVDLAHASNGTIAAALKIATAPVLISHTGLDTQLGSNPNMAKMMRPRLISKEEAKIVADAGGVIGVWTHLADTPEEYAKNIRALVDVTGVDHVAIGTDTKMTPAYRSPGGGGPGGPGGRPGERTNMAWADEKVGFYYAVVDALLKVGFSEAEIEKIGGGNFCRVFNASVK